MCLLHCFTKHKAQQLINELTWAFQQLLTCRNNLTLHTCHSVEAINRESDTKQEVVRLTVHVFASQFASLLRDTQIWDWHYERCYWHSHSVSYNRGVRGIYVMQKHKKRDICHDMRLWLYECSQLLEDTWQQKVACMDGF